MTEEEIPEDIKTKAVLEEMESALDDLVHDVASSIGSAVNNGGPMEQIRFLRENGINWDAMRAYLVVP